MIQTIRNAWRVPELKKKMLFTIMALLIFRLGSAIPVPYIDGQALNNYLQTQSGTILGLMNAMSGSAFNYATVFALSIQPYINSSIIIQLLTVAIPALERFEDGAVVNAQAMLDAGVLSKCRYGVKILGGGEITKKLTVEASAFSASAKEKIVAAGGKWEVV